MQSFFRIGGGQEGEVGGSVGLSSPGLQGLLSRKLMYRNVQTPKVKP